MAKKKKDEDNEEKEKKEPPLKKPILEATGSNKLIDAFRGTKKAKETAEAVRIEQTNLKRPKILDDPGSETLAASIARKKREEEDRKKMAKKPK